MSPSAPQPSPPSANAATGGTRCMVVVGAGISGLSAAWRLKREAEQRGQPLDIIVLEAEGRAGGVIHTERREDFLIEHGPDCWASNKPAGMELIRELGLEDQLIGTNPEVRHSFIVHKGTLKRLPQGFFLLAPMSVRALLKTPIISWPGKFRMALELLLPAQRDGADESLAHFVRRRFGREALERVAQPMVAGIYTADPEQLSLKATFPQFLDMEREHRSVIRALRKKARQEQARRKSGGADTGGEISRAAGPRYGLFVSLKGGMQTLTDRLAADLGEGVLRLSTRVTGLRRFGDGWSLSLEDGETIRADGVCLALPAQASARLLTETAPELATLLGGIPYADSAVVNYACRREDVGHALDGMGVVIPAVEKHDALALSFSSVKFAGRAPEGHVLLRVFMGGALQPEVARLTDAQILERAAHELSTLLGVRGEPLFATVSRHRGRMAQYGVGHLERVEKIRARVAGLTGLEVIGNGFDGIGTPDCIRNGNTAAKRLLDPVEQPAVS